jgi:poly(beta-D-mannuronate) lyase
MQRAENGLLYPEDEMADVGASKTLNPIQKDQVGASYYPKTEPEVAFDSGKVTQVKPTENALFNAIHNASSGDVLILENGEYDIGKIIKLDKTITIKAKNRKHVTLYPGRSTFVDINNFGSLKLVNLIISGKRTPDAAGNTLIRTSRIPMQRNFRLEIEGSVIEDLNVNHSFHLFDAGHRSFADYIKIANTTMTNITGDILRLNKETDDLGIYNAEYIYFNENLVENVEGAVAKVYRGGSDESTFGPHFIMHGNILKNVGKGRRNKSSASVYLHGVQVANISKNKIFDSALINIEHTVGQPVTAVTDNEFTNTLAPKIIELRVKGPHTATLLNNLVK